jgi:hypothetical protein
MLPRTGNAGSNTVSAHIRVLADAFVVCWQRLNALPAPT